MEGCWLSACAYTVLDNAKAMADKHEGYTVYDWNGKAVYGDEVTGGSGLAAEFSKRTVHSW